jgi:hypothetical protein
MNLKTSADSAPEETPEEIQGEMPAAGFSAPATAPSEDPENGLAAHQDADSAWKATGYLLSAHPPMRAERIPNITHLGLLGVITLFSMLCVGVFSQLAIHAHLFGLKGIRDVAENVHYMLAMQALLYSLILLPSLILFPLVWEKSLFAGMHWNARTAFRFRWRLVLAAVICFLLAMLNGLLLPGPSDAPIDKIFRAPGAAWMLFLFGTTFAPFFEEAAFRGFLLPTLCTAFDWLRELSGGRLPLRPCHNGHPRWTLPAMVTASIPTSILFALIHAEQTAFSLGPFLLLFTVSLVLCWVRLSTRSLAASVFVHAVYNLLLFGLMLIGTGGFQHLDKM